MDAHVVHCTLYNMYSLIKSSYLVLAAIKHCNTQSNSNEAIIKAVPNVSRGVRRCGRDFPSSFGSFKDVDHI